MSFNTTEFEKTIEGLEAIDTKAKKCIVELKLNYIDQHLEVIFNPINPTNLGITVESSLIVTTFTLDFQQPSIFSVLIHICSKRTACDRDFVLGRYSWLLNQNHTETQIKFTELLMRKKNYPISCVTKSSETDLEPCNGEVCNGKIGARWFCKLRKIDHISECGGKEKTSTSVRISTSYFGDESCDQHNEIFYTCMYHGCNNETTSYNVFYIIRDSYSICRGRYETINVTKRTLVTTTPKTSSIIQTKTSIRSSRTTDIYAQEITSTLILNRSFTTNIANRAIQDIQILLMLIKIKFLVLSIRFFLVNP
jgi:hypothetical protein